MLRRSPDEPFHTGMSFSSQSLALGAALYLAASFASAEPIQLPRQLAPETLKENVLLVRYEGTHISTPRQVQLALGRGQSLIRIQSMSLTSGRADVVVEGQKGIRGGMITYGSKFAAVCTGGRMSVVLKDGALAIVAQEEEALVGYQGKFKPLAPGMIRRLDPKSGDYTDEPLLASPSSSARPPIAGFLEGPVTIKLPATKVTGADGYIVRLYENESDVLVHEEFAADATKLTVTAPRAGRFRAHLFAVDKSGLEGHASPPIPVRVLGVAQHEQLVRFGSVYLEPGKRAAVVGTEGLLMRYGTSTELVPAAPTIGIFEAKPTSVEFRDPQDPHNSVVFPILPQLLKAEIDLGKATSEWPRDPLTLRFQVRNLDGTPVSDLSNYVARVTVNLNEVPVVWTDTESGRVATLEPQPGPGPWVVRLRLTNEHGLEIARNFLEVTEMRIEPKKELYASSLSQPKNVDK